MISIVNITLNRDFGFPIFFLKQQQKIQKCFYDLITLHKIQILFFDWFELYYTSKNHIAYLFTKYVCLIKTRNKTHI